MKYQPWVDFEKECEVLNIPTPPCPNCMHYKPQRIYTNTINGCMYEGVTLCHNDQMEHDFSCFTNKLTEFER